MLCASGSPDTDTQGGSSGGRGKTTPARRVATWGVTGLVGPAGPCVAGAWVRMGARGAVVIQGTPGDLPSLLIHRGPASRQGAGWWQGVPCVQLGTQTGEAHRPQPGSRGRPGLEQQPHHGEWPWGHTGDRPGAAPRRGSPQCDRGNYELACEWLESGWGFGKSPPGVTWPREARCPRTGCGTVV